MADESEKSGSFGQCIDPIKYIENNEAECKQWKQKLSDVKLKYRISHKQKEKLSDDPFQKFLAENNLKYFDGDRLIAVANEYQAKCLNTNQAYKEAKILETTIITECKEIQDKIKKAIIDRKDSQ